MTTCDAFEGYYFGQPGNMQALPTVDAGESASFRNGEQAHRLADDGTTVTRVGQIRRDWRFKLSVAEQDELNLLMAFYSGLMGPGPFALLSPMWRNLLDVDVSGGYARLGSVIAWTAPAGQTITADATVIRPESTSGVVRWHGAMNGSKLVDGAQGTAGSGDVVPADLRAVPYVSAEQFTLQMLAWVETGTANVALSLCGRNGDGTAGTDVSSAVTALTTSPQLLTVTAAPGAFTQDYLMPRLDCSTDTAPDILTCAPMLKVGASDTFAVGFGCPRLVFTAGPGVTVPLLGVSDASFTLDEV